MSLTAGTRLGPYEILAPLGAGGMGEVYKAKDSRLKRVVAIKVLPSYLSNDSERLKRFEQEACAAGMLNHPNILAIFDVGTQEGCPYVVSELVEGETLRERVRSGAIPSRKAIDYALQIARGLAAAHEKGIVHRDLKPENVIVTKDNRVKILDFGLAKLTKPESQIEGSTLPMAVPVETKPGVIMGTVGYMSPEQVRAERTDHRSDIFAFGAILYEMLSGRRAFRRESPVETMNAILNDEPPELAEGSQKTPPALERVVMHCLEKKPSERFQSAQDLSFALEALSGVSASGPAPHITIRRGKALVYLATVLFLSAIAVASFLIGRYTGKTRPPSFKQLTFRRGAIHSARFSPEGQTIVYSAALEGKREQLYSTRVGGPESRPLDLADTVFAISRNGDMLLTDDDNTLVQVSLSGGAPRELRKDVEWADWGPDGKTYALVYDNDGKDQLEYPPEKILYKTAGWISDVRVAPSGDLIAFMDHPILNDDRGTVAVVDLQGRKKTLTAEWTYEEGLSWAPGGREIWFTATRTGTSSALYGVTLERKERLIGQMAGSLWLLDSSDDGRLLLALENVRGLMAGMVSGQTNERDFSWLDRSSAPELSKDGHLLLFDEIGQGGGPTHAVYIRKTDGSPAVRLGDGVSMGLSPDNTWAISILDTLPSQVVLLPTAAGEPKPLPRGSIERVSEASWFRDGKRILLTGSETNHGVRCYVQDIDQGDPRPVTPEGVFGTLTSPDGKFIVASGEHQTPSLVPVEGGRPSPISGVDAEDDPIRWSADGRYLYLLRSKDLPAKVYRLDISTGRRELWKEIRPPDPVGVDKISDVVLTPDGKSYVYTYSRVLSDLYLVEGFK